MAARSVRRSARAARRRRATWLALAALVLAVALYARPIRSYIDTRETLERRSAEVAALRAEQARLDERLARSESPDTLAREARRVGFVNPGERLFIVKGIREWRLQRRSRSMSR